MRHSHRPLSKHDLDPHDSSHPYAQEAGHDHGHRAVSRQRLLWSLGLTGSMMIVELIGGLMANSLALVSDAAHMLTHFVALGLSYTAIRIAAMPTAPERSYGFYRAEILAAFVNGIFLAGATVYIVYESVVRLLHPSPVVGREMLLVALAGLAVNLVTAGLLWKAGHEDLNVRSAFLHMLGDTLSSVAVVIGAVIIMTTDFIQIDPLLSGVIALVIAVWSWKLLAASTRILIEATPPGLNLQDLERRLREVDPQIAEVHDLHVWEITTGMLSMTAIIVVQPGVTAEKSTPLLEHLREVARTQFAIGHAIFQIEAAESRTPE